MPSPESRQQLPSRSSFLSPRVPQSSSSPPSTPTLELSNMAPDRGLRSPSPPTIMPTAAQTLAHRAAHPTNFTFRGILIGLLIGTIICFSNTYFGLQTGWVSGMSMPSALIGFAVMRALTPLLLRLPSYLSPKNAFSPVENVLVQSVAQSVGTMPLGCGFVGVVPALEYLLKPDEGGPVRLPLGRLTLWALGVCFFGVVFAVPLRREVIIREKLLFPTGTATALMIGVLHGEKGDKGKGGLVRQGGHGALEEERRLVEAQEEREERQIDGQAELLPHRSIEAAEDMDAVEEDRKRDWKRKMKLLLICFAGSATYTIVTYFIPHIRDIPILGSSLANNWLWTLNPSPAYIGQGIIIGPTTTLHMLLGAILGWGILSPIAKSKGWAPGPVSDWTTGSKGWIVWISLAIMLADSLVSLGWLVLRPLLSYGRVWVPQLREQMKDHTWREVFTLSFLQDSNRGAYVPLPSTAPNTPALPTSGSKHSPSGKEEEPEADAPPEHLITGKVFWVSLILSLGLCVISIHYAFPGLIPLHLTLFSLVLAALLSIMGVRALGETDLNPVSGISKLTQLIFAVVPLSKAHRQHSIIINLLAGAVSEAGALQAGDLMQDLKTGHLLGASPKAQFWGQMIGSGVGAVMSAGVYRLYTKVYEVPGDLFQVPTGFVWVFTARLVTGSGLPPMVGRFAAAFGVLFALGTAGRVWGREKGVWMGWVPGGVAVAVGMYNTPSFTLARAIGGLLSWYWTRWKKREETPLVVLASGLILGEGVLSIVNLLLASLGVPHL